MNTCNKTALCRESIALAAELAEILRWWRGLSADLRFEIERQSTSCQESPAWNRIADLVDRVGEIPSGAFLDGDPQGKAAAGMLRVLGELRSRLVGGDLVTEAREIDQESVKLCDLALDAARKAGIR